MPDLFGYSHYERLKRSASISECGCYRYRLRRTYTCGGDGRVATFIMLNPSTADHSQDDPTIKRCMAFVRSWGMSTLSVMNLFAWRATDPTELLTASDPVGPRNDSHIRAARSSHLLICAWGASVPFGRDREVLKMLEGVPLYCLGTTKKGHPRHPLYVRGDQELIPFAVKE